MAVKNTLFSTLINAEWGIMDKRFTCNKRIHNDDENTT